MYNNLTQVKIQGMTDSRERYGLERVNRFRQQKEEENQINQLFLSFSKSRKARKLARDRWYINHYATQK